MKRLLLLATACLLMFGCMKTNYNKVANKTVQCVNGHLYYISEVVAPSGRVAFIYSPVFDARTNVPTLISCPDVEDGALLVKGEK